MSNLFLILVCLLLAIGCSSGNVKNGSFELENEVFAVAEKYLENSAAGNWNKVYDTLSGEALAEARANAGRAKSIEKIISKNLQITKVCEGVAEISADFTISSNGGFDRLAYNFRLKKHEGGWLIYKTTYGEYHRSKLKSGPLPSEAAGVIKTYIELPLNHRRIKHQKFLSGKLLQESQKAALLPLDSKDDKYQGNIKTVVKNMDCLGLADGYAIVRVIYDVIKDNTTHQMEMLVDVLDVNGAWKICGMNVTKA